MIYIINEATNTITTDNLTDYLPTSVKVYLDNTLIGSYVNEKVNSGYIVFTIAASDLINLENKEYKMKLINNDNATVIKTELVVLKSSKTIQFSEVINNKTEVFYE